MAKKENKRGAFSTVEMEFIKRNRETMNVDQMGEELGRSPEAVQKNLYKIDGSFKAQAVAQEFEAELKAKPYWPNLVRQYSDAELLLYQYQYVNYSKQFQEGKTHAEESQILKLIDLEIMLERLKLEHNVLIKTIEDFQRAVDAELEVEGDKTDATKAYITNLNNQIMGARAAITNAQKTYNEVLDKHIKLMASLKATRDQRLKDVETKDVTFFGWLKAMSDKTVRDAVSRDAEMMKLAMGKLKGQLGEYHQYEDGEIDRPLLNHETVELGEDENVGQDEGRDTVDVQGSGG